MTEHAVSIPRVRRLQPSQALLESSVSHFQQKLTSQMEQESYLIREQLQHLANVTAPFRSIIQQDPAAAASLAELHKSAQEEHRLAEATKSIGAEPARTFSFPANPGFQVVAPPYDLDWSNRGHVFPLFGADKNTGKIISFSLDGPQSAAVGIFLSASEKSLVRVAPFARFHYVWSGFDYNRPAWVRGSTGVVVYVNGDPLPAFDYRAELWNARFDFPSYRARGSGSSTISRELPRDVLIPMEPGNSYLVWVWCGVVAHSGAIVDDTASGGSGGFATGSIDCDVPFIVIDAGPPVLIR